MATAQFGMTNLIEGQAMAEIRTNEAIVLLDAVSQMAIKDRDLATPPGSPVEGDRYIIANSPTGAWAGNAQKFTFYRGTGWVILTPKEGWLCFVQDENRWLRHDGTNWVEAVVEKFTLRILNPGAAENAFLFYCKRAMTCRRVNAALVGSSTPSLTWGIRRGATRDAGAPTAVLTAAALTSTSGVETTAFTSASIPAGQWVWIYTTAQSGTVNELNLELELTED